ncbi:hypothetical protein PZ938_13535 [Luteipulveratus sp. YIM 133132]|nr:hypothetical protein [Luteipulveratus sp. YIM 133132]MDE9366630.1 hypothetical protein [Luteipulveratus sp. YIM 133132]
MASAGLGRMSLGLDAGYCLFVGAVLVCAGPLIAAQVGLRTGTADGAG